MHESERSADHTASDQERAEAELVARIAPLLRAPERLDATFEVRVMSAIDSRGASVGSPSRHRSWWTRPRTFSISPITMLAIAAGIAGILATGAMSLLKIVKRPAAAGALAVGQVDTVHLVRFALVAPSARSVALVGDFNAWNPVATQLDPSESSGVWRVSVPLTAGRHEYAFIVDGERWVVDPLAATVHDDYGTESSVVTLGISSAGA